MVVSVDLSRSMRSAEVRAARRAMLTLPHISPLTQFAADLRVRHGVEVPDFDPADGGIRARILFLKEKPGPMTSSLRTDQKTGSGFISRDNDDDTAQATFDFMKAAGIRREDTLMWNVVPGWNGTIKIKAKELREGVAEVRNLLALLPLVEVVVLVGRKAARAEPLLSGTGVTIFHSFHPSRRVRNRWKDRWESIPRIWAEAAGTLEKGGPSTDTDLQTLRVQK